MPAREAANEAMRQGSTKGAIASGHELTAKAGLFALREGGTAVDAAIAAAWMACVVEPVLASPGGGGFAMVTEGEAEPRLCDFFAQTPRRQRAGADFRAIEADFGTTCQTFHIGHGSTAAPGFVPGLFALHAAHGRLPMARLIAPAAATARRGHVVNAFQASLARIIAPILTHSPSARALFAPGGAFLHAGETFRNPGLARFLELLADGGLAAYENEAVPAMVADQAAGGHLGEEDFAAYEVIWRRPLRGRVGRAEVWLNPPPAASGVMIALALLALEEAGADGACASCRWARALDAADRARRAAGHDPHALLARLGPPASRGTTHISAMDAGGGACALTISNGEGNGHVVPGFGFMLNNMLGEEDVNPAGEEGWPRDVRMSSMMAPTLARAPGAGLFALGSGGSNRIRSVIFLVLQRLLAQGFAPEGAVSAPRLHVEGGHLDFEPGFSRAEAAALAAAFPDHRAWPERSMFFGGCHVVSRSEDGTLAAVGDERRAGIGLMAE